MQLIENASEQKLRGAYYTPSAIADFILRWGLMVMAIWIYWNQVVAMVYF